MKGDFTRFTFDGSKRYSSVRMQQGRVLIDSDWNEQLDIDAYRDTLEAKDVIGLNGVPQSDMHSFEVTLANNNTTICINKGRCYVNGILCENEENIDYTKQPDLPEAELPKTEGKYFAYLDVWQRHITAIEDPSIREQALGGADTTTRTKTIWQCKLLKVAEKVENQEGKQTIHFLEWDELLKSSEKKGKLHVQTRQEPEVNYENALYRVEIHKSGKLGEATFKWSRNNGAIAAKIKEINGNKIIIESNLQTDFAAGQWIEITDERNSLWGEPGVFVELTEVKGSELSIKEWPKNQCPTSAKKSTVRRWDSAPLILKKQENYIPLENGLEVKFEEGIYTSGDYWLIPTRSGETIDWDNAQAPYGIDHHYGLLATLRFGGQTWTVVDDCREIFAPLTEATKRISDIEKGSLTLLDKENETLKVKGKLELKGGVAVSQFSKDGTLNSNSDDIVPTEQAVKKYVDNKWEETFENQIQFKSQFGCCEEEKLKTLVTIKACDLGYSVVPLYLRPNEQVKVQLENGLKIIQAKIFSVHNEEDRFICSRKICPIRRPQEIDINLLMGQEQKDFLNDHSVNVKALLETDVAQFQYTINKATIKQTKVEHEESVLFVEPDSCVIEQTSVKVILTFEREKEKEKAEFTIEKNETRSKDDLTKTNEVEDITNKTDSSAIIEGLVDRFIKLSWKEKVPEIWKSHKGKIEKDIEKILRNYLTAAKKYRWFGEKKEQKLEVCYDQIEFHINLEEIQGNAYLLYVTYSQRT